MDFDSPDVMKEFPGLYAIETSKKCRDDSDFSDDPVKIESTLAKKKDKKDKKDKEKGYAALEGESSGDENSKSSPSKYKKTKSFKFTASKSKKRRDKSRDKDDKLEKNEEKDKKREKRVEKDKLKVDKLKKIKLGEDSCKLADTLPIFGVNLCLAVERSKCHDGVDIPLLVRQCIDYLETVGILFEGIYKTSGTKSKVLQLRKMFNNREHVDLMQYDVPTSTSLLKMFLRDLPEPLFTNDLLVRFEEAGAILSAHTREKHLRILIDNLPSLNKLLLCWLLVHLDNVAMNEKVNKMSRNSLAASLNHTFHVSTKLLTALIQHSRSLFPDFVLFRYIPPLHTGAVLPSDAESIQLELAKQESLLNQIHMEMNFGCIVKEREELLWEVQRIITQLKRKMKSFQKEKELSFTQEKIEQDHACDSGKNFKEDSEFNKEVSQDTEDLLKTTPHKMVEESSAFSKPEELFFNEEKSPEVQSPFENRISNCNYYSSTIDEALALLKLKNNGLLQLQESIKQTIHLENKEIENLKRQLAGYQNKIVSPTVQHNENLDKIMDLVQKENQILQIKKINLVRQIIEQQETCIELKAKIVFWENYRI